MDMLDSYKIDLKNLRTDSAEYRFRLDDAFFEAVGGDLVTKGNADVVLDVRKTAGAFDLAFHIQGVVKVPCDRCLDDMDQKIDATSRLKVKFGDEYADEGDLIVLPYEDGVLDVAWNIYEFIVLEIPIKHVHAPGACNAVMMNELYKHLAADADGDDGMNDEAAAEAAQKTDPRWAKLKEILDNN